MQPAAVGEAEAVIIPLMRAEERWKEEVEEDALIAAGIYFIFLHEAKVASPQGHFTATVSKST